MCDKYLAIGPTSEEATQEVLNDPELLARLLKAEENVEKGLVVDWDDVREDIE